MTTITSKSRLNNSPPSSPIQPITLPAIAGSPSHTEAPSFKAFSALLDQKQEQLIQNKRIAHLAAVAKEAESDKEKGKLVKEVVVVKEVELIEEDNDGRTLVVSNFDLIIMIIVVFFLFYLFSFWLSHK